MPVPTAASQAAMLFAESAVVLQFGTEGTEDSKHGVALFIGPVEWRSSRYWCEAWIDVIRTLFSGRHE